MGTKMKKIAHFLIVFALVVLSLGSLSASAEGESPQSKIYSYDTSVTAGYTTYITIYASDLDLLGSLELYAFYDPDVFSISYSSVRSLMSSEQVVTNTSTPGEASFNMISATGVSGSGSIWEIGLTAKSTAPAGAYNLVLAVGEAYDTNLNPVTVSTTTSKITVNSPTVTRPTMSMYWSGSSYTYYKDDSVTVNFATRNAYDLSSVDFELEYDETMLELVSVSLGSKMTSSDGDVYSINSDLLGYVKISYVNMSGITGSIDPMVSVTFKVIADESSSTPVKLTASNIYNSTLELVNGSTVTRNISIGKRVVAPELPKISVGTFDGTEESFDISIMAPGDTGLAAIDFEISFDQTKINCLDAVCNVQDCLFVSKIDNENGIIKFSFICMDGITADTELAKLTFSRAGLSGGMVTLGVVGKNAVDSNSKSISFEYESPTLICHVLGPEPTCTEAQICTICSKQFKDPLGHDEIPHEGQDPTCSAAGWHPYVTCSRCDYITYVEMPALGHDEITHAAQDATCTEYGWYDYVTCSRCDFSTYQQIEPYGHRVTFGTLESFDPLVWVNDANYPFSYNESTGEYASTNKYDSTTSTFTINVLYDSSLTIYYRVSSEVNYDFLTIERNGKSVDSISGSTGTTSKTLVLYAGDVVTFRYSKDGSAASGTDTGYFRLKYENVVIDNRYDLPADSVYPTCVDAVVCSYCQILIKEALGHDETTHEAQAPTCTEIGWDAYVTCSRCDHTTYVEIPALGHDEINHAAQDATCTEIGWYDYVTCSRCDFSTYQQIDPYGHRVQIGEILWVDPLEITNDPNYPFSYYEGKSEYSSTNKVAYSTSTFTIVALYDCSLTVRYRVSSESGYDWLIIRHNGAEIDSISGNVSTKTKTLELAAGDVITISYSKDGSTNNGSDTAYFTLDYGYVAVGSIDIVPAESIMPTCTDAVICHFCNVEVTPALGHAEILHTGKAPNCFEYGWDDYATCLRCDYTTYKEIPALGHCYGEWIDEVPPTCVDEGIFGHYTCIACLLDFDKEDNYLPSIVIPAQGHDYFDWVPTVAPTCTDYGEEIRSCKACDHYETGTIDALGHHEITHEAQEPTCTDIGWDAYSTCSRCDYTTYNEIAELGHDAISYEGKDATCTEMGWYEYTVCDRCGYTTYTEIAELGHDEINHTAQDATCTEVGWYDYVTCSRCDYSTYQQIEPYGHRVQVSETVWVDPIETVNDYTYPFQYDEGIGEYYSTNKTPNSYSQFTINVLYNCSLTVTYHVSSELIYDTLIINVNNTESANVSGEVNPEDIVLDLKAGDTVTILYLKDFGTNVGQDTAWFKLTYNQVAVENITYVPAEDVEPTCTDAVICHFCGIEVTPALGHALISHDGKYPNCFEHGWDSYFTCSRCDYTTYNEIPALGHYYDAWIDEVPPTCLEDGVRGHYTCVVCLSNFDEEHNYLISIVIPAQGHDYFDWVPTIAPTCTDDGEESRSCKMCDHYETRTVDALGHYYVDCTAKAPTCVDVGWEEYTYCNRCDYTTYVEVAPLGHDEITHEAQAPTCTDIGWEEYITCSRCDHTTRVEIPELGHDEIDHAAKDATCTEVGWCEYVSCERCDYTTYIEIAKLGHDEITHEAQAPTCTEHGWNAYATCSRCDYTTYVEIAPLGHDEITHEAQAPTCTEYGWNAYATCSRCDYTTYVEIPAPGHSVSDWIVDAVATCTADGSRHKECTACNLVMESEVLPMLGHDEIRNDAQAPTCTEIGWDEYVSCSRCEYTTYVQIPELGHVLSDATCTQASKCQREGCDHVEKEALGHVWIDATCTTMKTCSRCGLTEGAVLGHCFENYVSNNDATCIENGTSTARCERCDATDTVVDVGSVLGHSVVIDAAVAPTCTTVGYTSGKHCSVCNEIIAPQLELPKISHTYTDSMDTTCNECGFERDVECLHTDIKILAAKPVTCTTDGLTEGTVCQICEEILVAQITIPATGHKEIIDVAVAATCIADGLTEGKHCSLCGEIFVKQGVVNALGHNFEEYVFNNDAACTENGTKTAKCSRCDETDTLVEINSNLGHDFLTYVSCGDATCTADGTKTAKCSRCDETDTVTDVGSKLGHDMSDATCTEVSKCQRADCGYTEGTALGHNFAVYTSCGDATCTADGTKTAKCSRCDETDTVADVGSKLDHVDGDDNDHLCDNGCNEIVDGGCHDEDADTDHKCDECGNDDITPHTDTNSDGKCDACECDMSTEKIENTESGVKVETVTGGGAVLPEGAEISVGLLSKDDVTEQEIESINNSIKGEVTVVAYYDLHLIHNSAYIHPNGKLLVTLPKVVGNYDSIKVVYIADDGSIEECKTTVNADGTVSFETDHFSKYAIIGITNPTDTNEPTADPDEATSAPVVVIVIACVVAAGLIGFALYWFVIRKKFAKTPENEKTGDDSDSADAQ